MHGVSALGAASNEDEKAEVVTDLISKQLIKK